MSKVLTSNLIDFTTYSEQLSIEVCLLIQNFQIDNNICAFNRFWPMRYQYPSDIHRFNIGIHDGLVLDFKAADSSLPNADTNQFLMKPISNTIL